MAVSIDTMNVSRAFRIRCDILGTSTDAVDSLRPWSVVVVGDDVDDNSVELYGISFPRRIISSRCR